MSLQADWESRGISLFDILKQLIEGKSLDDSLEESLKATRLSNSYIRGTLIGKYRELVRTILVDLLHDWERFYALSLTVKKDLQLDQNWILAVICLCAQDIAVAKKAETIGIPLIFMNRKTGKEEYSDTSHLLREIKKRLEPEGAPPSGFLISGAYNEEYRNKIIHRGIQIDRKAADQILDTTKQLFTGLGLAK